MKNHLYIKWVLFLVMLSLSCESWAQNRKSFYYIEPYVSRDLSKFTLGGSLGITIFKNDLHSLLDASAQNNFMNFYGSIDASFRITNYLSLRAGIGRYQLYGSPADGAATLLIQESKPSVSSSNTEGYLAIVHDLFSKERIDRGKVLWNVYALGGIGLTYFNPTNTITGEELRPAADDLGFQEYPYASLMPVFPVGLGFSYYFTDNQAVSFEATYRFSTSDWFDNAWWWENNASPNYDGYAFVGFRYQHTLLSSGGKGSGYNYKGYQKRTNKRKR